MPTTQEDQARIGARYPKTGVTTWLIVGCALVATIAGAAWLIWTSLFHANPALVAQVESFVITSSGEASATIKTQRNSVEVAGTCTIVAQAVTFERVGELEIAIPSGGTLLSEHPVTIKTLKRATSVSVEGCRAN